MARKVTCKKSKNQLRFQFIIDIQDVPDLIGGSQESLSDFEARFRLSVKATLDACAKRETPLDRATIAAKMTEILGREITKGHLDQWAALSAVQRRMHVDALKAFCEVTGDWQAFHTFVESCGFKALDPQLAICAEYGSNQLLTKMLAGEAKNLLTNMNEAQLKELLLKRLTGEL